MRGGMAAAATCALTALATVWAIGCAPGESDAPRLVVDTLPNGAPWLRYATRDGVADWTLRPELTLGAMEGEETVVFGDVRDVGFDVDGTLLVLDGQAGEIRRFSPEGAYLETVVRKGKGPREVGGANGFMVADDGTLWINDPGNWRVVAVRPDGGFLTREMAARLYGYRWAGAVTEGEWVWDHHVAGAPPPTLAPGVHASSFPFFYRGLSPDGAADSVLLGTFGGSMIRVERGSMGVPFQPTPASVLDPSGVIWFASTDAYRIVKQSLAGDTLLVVELPPDPHPIPDEERAEAIQRIEDFMERAGRIDLDYDELLAKDLPALEHLTTDDQGRLWVGRLAEDGVLVFDVFQPDGTYLAVARCACQPYRHFVPSIRGNQFLTVVRDEMEVPFVVRARITPTDGKTP